MTVKELIAKLSAQDPESKVHFAYDWGDYVHTIVCPEIRVVSIRRLGFSEGKQLPIMDETGSGEWAVVLDA